MLGDDSERRERKVTREALITNVVKECGHRKEKDRCRGKRMHTNLSREWEEEPKFGDMKSR